MRTRHLRQMKDPSGAKYPDLKASELALLQGKTSLEDEGGEAISVDVNPILAAVNSDQVIEIGDLLYYETDDVRPASSQLDQGSKVTNQELFVMKFLGVALDASAAGETDPIRVATKGAYDFDCAENALELGDLMGPNENGAGNALLDQTAVKVAKYKLAFGRVAIRKAAGLTKVTVNIRSTIIYGGIYPPVNAIYQD